MSKPKKINFELIAEGEEPYQILGSVREFHPTTSSAKVALAWRLRTKADQDGRLVLGKCIRTSDLQREFSDYDYIILLNREVWEDPEFTEDRKRALVDHECCHMSPAEDEDGEKVDERGRQVWRTRGHSIEEFHEIVQRHGTYKRDLALFAEALLKKRKAPLLDGQAA